MATLLVGAYLAFNPASLFMSAALMAGANYIDQNYLFPQKVKGSRLQDLKIQTSSYGTPISQVWGRARVAGKIIWGTKFVEHKKTSKQGGKGGGGTKVTEYSYSVSFATEICKGPIKGIRRVWSDGKPFPLYESKYSVKGTYRNRLTFDSVDSDESSTWTLTAKNVDDAQVLGVRDAEGNEYPDCYFGVYYSNDLVQFTVDKKTESTSIPDGAVFTLSVNPHTAKYEFAVYTGTETQTPDSYIESIEGVGNVPAYRGTAYIVFRNMYIDDFGRRIPSLTFEAETPSNNLAEIVTEICAESGIPSGKVDVSDLEGITITGNSIERTATGAEKLTPLQTAYMFDCFERNAKLIFRRRSASNAVEIPYDDLGAFEGSDAVEPLQKIRAAETELPRRLTVKYISSNFDYQEQTVSSKRQLTQSKNEVTVDTGVVLTDSDAQELADKLLYEEWTNRVSYELALTSKYVSVLPGTVLKVSDEDEDIHTMIVAKSSYGKPGLNKISAMAIDGVVYKSASRTVDSNTTQCGDQAATQVNFEFLDLPHLPADATTTNNIYFAACGEVYSGVNVYKTNDGGASYDLVAQFTAESTMGYAITQLQSGTTSDWDNVNTVDVVLLSGTLESRPETDILNGFNAAVIGNEVIQFKTAALIGTDTYRLSGLLRGKLGTEGSIADHTSHDRFVLLQAGIIGVLPTTDLGIEKTYRVGPTTQAVDDITYTEIKFTYTKSGSGTFTYTQSTAENIWNIEHNLSRYPVVICIDENGNQLVGEVRYTSVNSLTVTFSTPLTGTAYLM